MQMRLKICLFLCGVQFHTFVYAQFDPETMQFFSAPARDALWIYRRWIGPAKGKSCLMAPTDSAYARQAIERYGFLGGTWRAADRLHRCGHDVQDYPIIQTEDGLRYDDPLNP